MRKITGYLLLAVMALFFLAQMYLRFSNMDMTETMLFINFWPQWLAYLAGTIAAYGLYWKASTGK